MERSTGQLQALVWRVQARKKTIGISRPLYALNADDEVTQPDAPWVLAHKETGEVFRSYFKRPNRNWSEIWIRGRKADTFGKLEIRPNDNQHKSAVTEPEDRQGNNSINLESFDKQTVAHERFPGR